MKSTLKSLPKRVKNLGQNSHIFDNAIFIDSKHSSPKSDVEQHDGNGIQSFVCNSEVSVEFANEVKAKLAASPIEVVGEDSIDQNDIIFQFK